MDEGTRQVLVLLITTLGTIAVAWIRAHPGPNARRKKDDPDQDE